MDYLFYKEQNFYLGKKIYLVQANSRMLIVLIMIKGFNVWIVIDQVKKLKISIVKDAMMTSGLKLKEKLSLSHIEEWLKEVA